MWSGQHAALGDRYRLITWDMRGHGQTETPDDPAQYSTELTVADTRGLRAQPLGGAEGLRSRQPEHALADDVALDLARSRRDRVLPRGEHAVEPARRVRHGRGGPVHQDVHAQEFAGGVRDPHPELRAAELQDGSLGSR